MRGLIRIVFLLVLVATAISLIRTLLAALTAPRSNPEVPGGPGMPGRFVKDPVCGTYVPEGTSIHSGDNFFCSEECRTRFAGTR